MEKDQWNQCRPFQLWTKLSVGTLTGLWIRSPKGGKL